MNRIKLPKLFNQVGGIAPGKSAFDLSYEKLLTCDMGQLIPILAEEAVPGDVWEIAAQALIKFQPLVAPIMHTVNVFVHYFFVPYRLIWNYWEDFITGGADGQDSHTLPRWDPAAAGATDKGTLWDYFGFPVGVRPNGAYPLDFPRRAYCLIYNEYYRDETLQDELDITELLNNSVLRRDWEKDYFTSALPFQQRGTAPAFPIAGTSSAEWAGTYFADGPGNVTMQVSNVANDARIYTNGAQATSNLSNMMNGNTVDLSTATPLDIADIRIGFQVQKWLERNARAGSRYTEFLQSHFAVSPRDERLQRPEYIGGSKSPVIISEVLQNSETDGTPQGNMAGHGVSINSKYISKYRVQEFGVIMGIMSIMPKPVYQQGINRQWLRNTRYDFYFPEFAHLSEQGIIRAEIFCDTDSNHNNALFGYQGQYDEMRIKQNMVCGDFRDTYDYWHMSRQFASYPTLNSQFLQCIPRKDCFAAPSEPGVLVQFGNIIKAIRPMPGMANPGLIDH